MKFELAQEQSVFDALRALKGDVKAEDIGIKNGPAQIEIKGDGAERTIQGYFSTRDLDDERDILLPTAFEGQARDIYMQHPILHMNHDWGDMPIGLTLDFKIDERGAYVTNRLSKTSKASDVWLLIQDTVFRAYSHLFRIAPGGWTWNEDTGIRTITKLSHLFEISVVDRPANRAALLEVVKSALGSGFFAINHNPKGEHEMDPTELKKAVDASFSDARKIAVSEAKDAAKDEAKTVIETGLTPVKNDITSLRGEIVKIQEAVKATQGDSELKELVDKVSDKVKTLEADAAKLRARDIDYPVSGMLADFKSDESAFEWELSAAAELKCSVAQARVMLNDPKKIATGATQELIDDLQKAAMDVYTVHTILSADNAYRGPKTLKVWKRYERLAEMVGKALDTIEHSQWVPVGFTGEIIRRIGLELNVVNKFRRFTMTEKTFDWPYLGATRPTMYKVSEATADSAAGMKASTPSAGKVTFTAVKGGVRLLASVEMIEDALTAILPILQDDMKDAILRGLEDTCINGDSDGTHQDSDVTAADDHRTMWDGLRKKALAVAGSKSDPSGAKITAAGLRGARKLLGVRAANPKDLFIVMGVRDYIDILDDPNVATADKFTAAATWLTGVLTAVDGMPILVSEFSREDLATTGYYTGTGSAGCPLIVHGPSWALGDRRTLTIKSQEIIKTDQVDVVGYMRMDFKNIQTENYPVAALYNTLG